jgi:hypothetical protein
MALAGVKLIPVLLWLSQFQDASYAGTTVTLPYLYEILLGRHLHGAEILPSQNTGWHEYGAYVGPLVLALALLGLTSLKNSRLIQALALSSTLAILLSSAGPTLQPIFDVLPIIPRSTISRVIFFVIIPLALLAGLGLDQLRRLSSNARLFASAIVGLAAVSLMSLSYPLSQQAFVVPADDVRIDPVPSPIAFTRKTHEIRIDGVDYTRSYPAAAAGFGTLNYCPPLGPRPRVVAVEEGGDSSAVTLSDPKRGSVQLVSWSPNAVEATADIKETTEVVINTNYAREWKVNGQPAREVADRVGVVVGPGTHQLRFTYRAPGFIAGLIITLSALLAAAYFLLLRRK